MQRSDVMFDHGLDVFGAVVDRLSPDDWDHPSACAGWTNLDVLGHLGAAMRMGVSILRGEPPTWTNVERPGVLVEGEPAAWWRAVSADARAALAGADLDRVVDSPMGPRSIGDGLAFPAIDLYLHAWDVGHPLGIETELSDDLMAFAHHYIGRMPAEVVRKPGIFGPEVPVPADASERDRFLAWTGRSPR